MSHLVLLTVGTSREADALMHAYGLLVILT